MPCYRCANGFSLKLNGETIRDKKLTHFTHKKMCLLRQFMSRLAKTAVTRGRNSETCVY